MNYKTHCPQYVLNLGIRTQPDSRCNGTNILYRSLLDRKGEGRGSASFVRVEPSLHRRTVSIDHIRKCWLYSGGVMPGRRAGSGVGKNNAKSRKQGSKRFNYQVRRNTLPIWVWIIYDIKTWTLNRIMPEYRKLVKQFNDAWVVLMKHEVRVQLAWLHRNPSIRDMESKMAMPVLR